MEIKARYIVLGPDETLADVDRYIQTGQTTTLADLEKAGASDFQRATRRDSLTLEDLRKELNEILTAADEQARTDHPEDCGLGYEGLSSMYRFFDAAEAKRSGCPFTLKENGRDKLEELPYRWICVFPVTGSNEGHYIHVEMVWQKDYKEGRVCLFLTKTFAGHAAAVQIAGILCRVLGV